MSELIERAYKWGQLPHRSTEEAAAIMRQLIAALEQSEERVKKARHDGLKEAVNIAQEYEGSNQPDDVWRVIRDIECMIYGEELKEKGAASE